MSRWANALRSSQTATMTAATTITMKPGFQNANEAMIATASTTPDPMAAGRSRPARLAFGPGVTGSPLPDGAGTAAGGGSEELISGGSDLEQLSFLVLEEVVDRVHVLL